MQTWLLSHIPPLSYIYIHMRFFLNNKPNKSLWVKNIALLIFKHIYRIYTLAFPHVGKNKKNIQICLQFLHLVLWNCVGGFFLFLEERFWFYLVFDNFLDSQKLMSILEQNMIMAVVSAKWLLYLLNGCCMCLNEFNSQSEVILSNHRLSATILCYWEWFVTLPRNLFFT